jgi:hypothetical protein
LAHKTPPLFSPRNKQKYDFGTGFVDITFLLQIGINWHFERLRILTEELSLINDYRPQSFFGTETTEN